MTGDMLNEHASVDRAAWRLLERAADRFRLSMRAAYRVVRVSRTIADLSGSPSIAEEHIAEALSLRQLDR